MQVITKHNLTFHNGFRNLSNGIRDLSILVATCPTLTPNLLEVTSLGNTKSILLEYSTLNNLLSLIILNL